MGNHIEVESVRVGAFPIATLDTELHITVAGLGVVPVDLRNDFQALVGLGKMPDNLVTEIAFPDVEHTPERGKDVGADKFPALRIEVIEMTVRPGFCRAGNCRRQKAVGRGIRKRAFSNSGSTTYMRRSAGPGLDLARRCADPDGLRLSRNRKRVEPAGR